MLLRPATRAAFSHAKAALQFEDPHMLSISNPFEYQFYGKKFWEGLNAVRPGLFLPNCI
jgi:hypothetical protein